MSFVSPFRLSNQAVDGEETLNLDDTALSNVLGTMRFFFKSVLCEEPPQLRKQQQQTQNY